MSQRIHETSGHVAPARRAVAAVAMVVILLVLDLIIVGIVIGLSRDHDLTIRRMQTLEALYAAEAGVNMSIRELMNDADEDGDGATGTISDDSNDANDPTLGNAQFVVTAAADTPVAGQTTLTSEGRSGEARRKIEGVMEDPPP
ncbi:MAG: hypothetical protein ACYSU7_00330 [Planctomycetota bacterium]|jgi:hypothetical protein